MPVKSPMMTLFLEPFKAAAGEGAAVELKMRLLSGTIPALQKYTHQDKLEDIEDDLAKHFGDSLSAEDKETLRLCRQLRNKVLHSDFRAARDKLNELGTATPSGGVRKIGLTVPTIAEASKKILAAKEGTEGILVSDTPSTDIGGVAGWFMEAGMAGDFKKAIDAFKKAAGIVDRLAGAEPT